MLLGILLDEVVRLTRMAELLAVTGYSALTRVDWTLNRRNHVQKHGVFFRISDVVEPWMLQCLFACKSVGWIHP